MSHYQGFRKIMTRCQLCAGGLPSISFDRLGVSFFSCAGSSYLALWALTYQFPRLQSQRDRMTSSKELIARFRREFETKYPQMTFYARFIIKMRRFWKSHPQSAAEEILLFKDAALSLTWVKCFYFHAAVIVEVKQIPALLEETAARDGGLTRFKVLFSLLLHLLS